MHGLNYTADVVANGFEQAEFRDRGGCWSMCTTDSYETTSGACSHGSQAISISAEALQPSNPNARMNTKLKRSEPSALKSKSCSHCFQLEIIEDDRYPWFP